MHWINDQLDVDFLWTYLKGECRRCIIQQLHRTVTHGRHFYYFAIEDKSAQCVCLCVHVHVHACVHM